MSLSDDSIAAISAVQRTAYAGEPKYSRLPRAKGADYAWPAAGVPEMAGHASWVDAYYPPLTKVAELQRVPLYEWLLSHRRVASPVSNASVVATASGPAARSGGKRHGAQLPPAPIEEF